MPAIQPARLKAQTLQLAELFSHPDNFARGLTELLYSYADHTFRHGREGEPSPLLAGFNTPPQVIRQVWLAITPKITLNPQAALELSDVLWLQRNYEHRILAADILGQLPESYETEIINRIQVWSRNERDEQVVEALLVRSLRNLMANPNQAIPGLAEHWMADPELKNQKLGLRLLHLMSSDSSYDNLPVIFRLLSPYLRVTTPELRADVISILRILIARSPGEIAYLLRQMIDPEMVSSTWLLRQVIREFPPEFQTELRLVLKRTAAVKPPQTSR